MMIACKPINHFAVSFFNGFRLMSKVEFFLVLLENLDDECD